MSLPGALYRYQFSCIKRRTPETQFLKETEFLSKAPIMGKNTIAVVRGTHPTLT